MEFKRVFTNRRMLSVFIVLLIAVAGIYMYLEHKDDDMEPEIQYEQMQAEYVMEYSSYIENIIKQSDKMAGISIFQNKDSYSFRNLEKTKSAYAHLLGIQVQKGNYKNIESVMNFKIVDYIIFVFGFMLVWSLFEDEKKGLRCISFAAPNGRGGLAFQRIGVLAAGNAIFVIGAYLILLLCSIFLYGGIGNWGNSIQSAMMFKDCILPVSVGEYYIIYVIIRVFMAFATSLFMWLILQTFRNHLISTGLLIAILAVEGILCNIIGDLNPAVIIKYINVFKMIQPGDILYKYKNINVNEYPMNCFEISLVVTLAVGMIGGIGGTLITALRKPYAGSNRLQILIRIIVKKIIVLYHKCIAKLPVSGMELYKVLVVHKGIIFIGIWVFLLVDQVNTEKVWYVGDSALMQEVYSEYSGPDDGRLREYVAQNEALLAKVDAEYQKICENYAAGKVSNEEMELASWHVSSYDPIRSSTEKLVQRLEYIDKVKDEQGIDVWFMHDKGYLMMWTDDGLYPDAGYKDQEYRALLAVIISVLLLCMVFSYDKSCNMLPLIHATPYGRHKLFYTKIAMSGILSIIICCVTYGVELYEVQNLYPISCLEAPIQSLRCMEKFPLRISVGAFMIMIEVIHCIMLWAVMIIIYAFSIYMKGIKGMMVSLIVLVVPEVLKMLGLTWCRYISVGQPVAYVEILQEQGFIWSVVSIVVMLVLGVVCMNLTRIRWCQDKRMIKHGGV